MTFRSKLTTLHHCDWGLTQLISIGMRIGFNRSVKSQAGHATRARKHYRKVAWPGNEANRQPNQNRKIRDPVAWAWLP